MVVKRTSIFKYIILLLMLCNFISCSDKNPTSPSKEDIQDEDVIEINNISFTVDIIDPIPTAFLNNFAKLFQNNSGIAQVKITNNNNIPVQIKCSFEINQYSEEITQTIKISVKDSSITYFTPVLSDETLNKLNEIKTVNCSVKAIQINEEAEKELFNQTYTRQMLARDVMMWGDEREFLPLIVTWVTPHSDKIKELISTAVKYPPKEFIGYQGSESKDGYAKRNISLFNNEEITVPPLKKLLYLKDILIQTL